MDTRREFIKKAAMFSGGASLLGNLPESIQKAISIDPPAGTSFMDAEHIVLLMQENRSFDHTYGSLRGVRGFNDPRAISLPNKNPVWLQTNANGETYAPFRMDIKDTKATWMHSLPHTWTNQVDARNEGKFDKWLDAKRSDYPEYANLPLTMGFYSREDLPFYYALADAFTICDQHFCSSLTGTTPNRLYFWTGTIREEQHESSYANVWNENVDYGSQVQWKSFPERLEENGIPWKIYQNEISMPMGLSEDEDAWLANFGDSPLQWFRQYNVQFSEKYRDYSKKMLQDLPGQIAELERQLRESSGNKDTSELKAKRQQMISFLRILKEEEHTFSPENFEKLTSFERNLHEKAFSTNKNDPDYLSLTSLHYQDGNESRVVSVPKGDIFHQFRQDVNEGRLPTVSWLVAPERFSDHPSSAWYGAWYVSEVLDILTKNPEVWKKTIFILTYDENDGYFDHVPPFVAPDPRRPETGTTSSSLNTGVEYITLDQQLSKKVVPPQQIRESSIGLGYRVPLVIASPWSRGGWVNSQVFDHTSCLQFLEKFLQNKSGKKIEESNVSAWRRTICGDLTSVFRPYNGEKLDNPAFLQRDAVIEGIHRAQYKQIPQNIKSLSKQDIEAALKSPRAASWMVRQEKGIRPSCSLPYQLEVDGKIISDKKLFQIQFHTGKEQFGEKSAGSPFNVHAPGNYLKSELNGQHNPAYESGRTWSFAVVAGDTIQYSWPLANFESNNYHLRVYGPNGFFREFAGDSSEELPDIALQYEKNTSGKFTGNIRLQIANKNQKEFIVEIVDNAYGSSPISKTVKSATQFEIPISLEPSSNWYDVSVRIKGNQTFEKRYAGRVETGKAGISDLAMG
ncbi:MAG: phospholipase C, phosphocholine-specific [Bacteroidetes bacterium]|nr:MAG: phospholipase C, phosphocholine-specific [Bacteroidota bacterium]